MTKRTLNVSSMTCLPTLTIAFALGACSPRKVDTANPPASATSTATATPPANPLGQAQQTCATPPPSLGPTLPVVLTLAGQEQLGYDLCWAALTSMVAQFTAGAKTKFEQCAVASLGKPGTGSQPYCCPLSGPMPTDCDRPAFPPFQNIGLSVKVRSNGWPHWSGVRDFLFDQQPPVLTYEYTAAPGAHMWVGVGADKVDQVATVQVFDPSPPGEAFWIDYKYWRDDDPGTEPQRTYYAVQDCTPATCDDDADDAACCQAPPSSCPEAKTAIAAGTLAAPSLPARPVTEPAADIKEAPRYPSRERAAKAGLITACTLAERSDPATLGFKDGEEARAAASKITTVAHDMVASPNVLLWRTVKDVDESGIMLAAGPQLRETPHRFDEYMYVLDGSYRGFVSVSKSGLAWQPVRYGLAKMAERIQAVETEAYRQLGIAPLPVRRPPLLFFESHNLFILKITSAGRVRYVPVGKPNQPVKLLSEKETASFLRSMLRTK